MKSAAIICATIIAAALIVAVGLTLYFSPYHSCVRALLAAEYEPADAALACLQGFEPESKPEGWPRAFSSSREAAATR